MERKLASVQLVEDILPHNDSDNLEIAVVLGWNVVIRRGEVSKNDKCIYLEIDSLVPADYPSWVPPALVAKKIRRIKTIKIRGVISQGLLVNFDIVKNYLASVSSSSFTSTNSSEVVPDQVTDEVNEVDSKVDVPEEIGADYTQLLRVEKWISPLESLLLSTSSQDSKSQFPTFLVPKTDEHRIQSYPKLLSSLLGKEYWGTLKIDGCSATYLMVDGKFMVCSRNEIRNPLESDLYWNMALQLKINDILVNYPDYALQGEIYGPKIQKNLLNVKTLKFAVFNIYEISKQSYLSMDELINFCNTVGLEHVPVIYHGECFNETVSSLLEKSKGFYPNTKNNREGIVWRDKMRTISFKSINNDFLLKYDA